MYKVRINQFEGPFDLLVYLLENARMDIYDIKVAEITEQYISYLKEMESLDVEVASEFIVLAAILIRLKSHMLLPRVTEQGEVALLEDPRTELAGRLAEYVRVKKQAELLSERYEYYSAVHQKPAEDLLHGFFHLGGAVGAVYLELVTLFHVDFHVSYTHLTLPTKA